MFDGKFTSLFIYCISLKIPESYEKCLRISSSVKRNPLPAPPSGTEWAKSYTANVGQGEKF
jgi:hypothetical protein